MKTLRFYKEPDNSWFVDLPEWTGAKADLQMVAGADTMLEFLSDGKTEVWLEISEEEFTTESLEETVKLYFVREATELKNGAFYNLQTFSEELINLEVWLCDVTLFVFGHFPKTIYISPSSYVKEEKKIKVAFGLVVQGHIPTIERMIAEYSAKNEINTEGTDLSHSEYLWDKIAKEIGWSKETAMLHYIRYLRNIEVSVDRKVMRDLVDNVWQDVKESEEVPSTIHADKLIDKTLEQQKQS